MHVPLEDSLSALPRTRTRTDTRVSMYVCFVPLLGHVDDCLPLGSFGEALARSHLLRAKMVLVPSSWNATGEFKMSRIASVVASGR